MFTKGNRLRWGYYPIPSDAHPERLTTTDGGVDEIRAEHEIAEQWGKERRKNAIPIR